jgi:hypothetical protein
MWTAEIHGDIRIGLLLVLGSTTGVQRIACQRFTGMSTPKDYPPNNSTDSAANNRRELFAALSIQLFSMSCHVIIDQARQQQPCK